MTKTVLLCLWKYMYYLCILKYSWASDLLLFHKGQLNGEIVIMNLRHSFFSRLSVQILIAAYKLYGYFGFWER